MSLMWKVFIGFILGKAWLFSNYYLLWPLYWGLMASGSDCDHPLFFIWIWFSSILCAMLTIVLQLIFQPTRTTGRIVHFYMIMCGMGFLNYGSFTVTQVCRFGQSYLIYCPYWKEKYANLALGSFYFGCFWFLAEIVFLVFIIADSIALGEWEKFDEPTNEEYNLTGIHVSSNNESSVIQRRLLFSTLMLEFRGAIIVIYSIPPNRRYVKVNSYGIRFKNPREQIYILSTYEDDIYTAFVDSDGQEHRDVNLQSASYVSAVPKMEYVLNPGQLWLEEGTDEFIFYNEFIKM